jgi:cytochrome c oxidase subunit I+III
MVTGMVLLAGSLAAQHASISTDNPMDDARSATLHAMFWWQALHVFVVILMGAFCVARQLAGKLNATQRVCFDNTRLLWLYTCAQGLLCLFLGSDPI